MNLVKRSNCFQFENDLVTYDEIHSLHRDRPIPIFHDERFLGVKRQLPVCQLQAHRVSVNHLHKPRTKILVNGDACVDKSTEEKFSSFRQSFMRSTYEHIGCLVFLRFEREAAFYE